MKKIITICDYCEKIIEEKPKFIQTGTEVDEDAYVQDEKDFRLDLCDDCFGAISSVLSTLILERRKDKEQSAPNPVEEGAALEQRDAAEKQQESAEERVSLKQQEPAEEAQDQEPAEEGAALEQQDAAKEQQEPKKKPVNEVDHGRIVALYKANPPRSIAWIAQDCRCSQQTVINHLIKEGIYKRKKSKTAEEA